QDQAVHDQPEIHSLETAQKSRRASAVAYLGEFNVREHFRPPPVTCEEENREQAAEAGAPPDPIAGDALRRNHPAHEQRRVSGERGGHHRRAGQPPGYVSTGDKELSRVSARTAAIVKADHQIDQQVSDDHQPISSIEGHVASSATLIVSAFVRSLANSVDLPAPEKCLGTVVGTVPQYRSIA